MDPAELHKSIAPLKTGALPSSRARRAARAALAAMLAVASTAVVCAVLVAVALRFALCPGKKSSTVPTLIVLGSGGHTTEMLRLISGLDGSVYRPVTLVLAATDTTSRTKCEGMLPASLDVRWEVIPRAREVGQSFRSSISTTLVALVSGVKILARSRPALVLANGPGTCVPLAVLGVYGGARLIFCESWCRVESLSLSGRLLYPIAHRFVVHWPQLRRKYPRAEYVGRLC